MYCNIMMMCCCTAGLVQCGDPTPALWDFQKLPLAPPALLMLLRLWVEDSPLAAPVPTHLLHWVRTSITFFIYLFFSFSSFFLYSLVFC